MNNNCSIECNTDYACQFVTINATHSSDLLIDAISSRGLQNSEIHCPNNNNCIINCDGFGSCRYNNIYGNLANYLNITVSGNHAFAETNVFALNVTKYLSIKLVSVAYLTFRDTNIYCPNNGPNMMYNTITNGIKYSCEIDSNTLNYWSFSNSSIYAIEGLNDVLLTGLGFHDNMDTEKQHRTFLHCTYNYSKSCVVDDSGGNEANNNWSSKTKT